MNVSIIGTGYVGLTTGVCLAFLGHKVTCIDSDEKKIALLEPGKTPIYEPFLTELLAEAQPNLHFCTRLRRMRSRTLKLSSSRSARRRRRTAARTCDICRRPRTASASTSTAISWWW